MLKQVKALIFTIPKNYNFEDKYKAITSDGYAWYETKNKPKQEYHYVIVIHKDKQYLCNKYETDKGIGFHKLMAISPAYTKGFQGFRYEIVKVLFPMSLKIPKYLGEQLDIDISDNDLKRWNSKEEEKLGWTNEEVNNEFNKR